MKKMSIIMLGCLLGSSLGIGGMYLDPTYTMPQPTKSKKVTIPRFFPESYIKRLTIDELEELIDLLDLEIESATGRALKRYQKMKELAEATKDRYEMYEERM